MATAAGPADSSSTGQPGHEQPLLLTAARSPSIPLRDSWHSVLPPLPRQRSPLVRSSSPRHLSAASSPPATRTTHVSLDSKFSTPIGPRSPSSAQPQSHHFDSDFNPPFDWGDDSADEFPLIMSANSMHDAPFDDQLLSVFADNDFSSPSSYPSFLNPLPATSPQADQDSGQHQLATTHDTGSGPHSRRPSLCLGFLASPSRSTTRSAGISQNTLFTNGFGDQDLSSEGAQSVGMPSASSRDVLNALDRAPAPKRRRLSRTGSRQAQLEPLALPIPPDDDDLFADNEKLEELDDMNGLTTIDLTEANEVPEELKKPKVDNRVKISAFQCAICMDDVTTLTVTHCGHLYCQQCLHSSLNVDSTKGKCPMCRTKIDMKSRSSYSMKTKGFWPLELKLMTTTSKGKRKAASTP
ncbi:zinc finger, c3HC4 type (RING finger) domain-containing protein [Hirsutella rhossiliensis]|uniref:Zinc finger, c3HC4 type (RING finger) domain-containing protein n=1 Tax=Hirsutella rhossiliensis TaxID=111463 RepID=A0A9P8SDY5_9HYPO|nr:zinc finger, c3HC4 type (RING finger) domain-containing protein [Hirsutella rhossiliensis]KAH0959101.1 zinc finger, c3HC4 type (RING finger) domain-containing protein [Hirsutella rhossiliensis]